MSLLDAARFRLRTLLRPGAYARELDEEMRFHLSLEAMEREHRARGAMAPTDAWFGARRRFGNVTVHTEEARRMAGLGFLDVARQDARFALRSFRRTPGFTLVALLTLAVGIGATTAIFSAVHALLLRPLPFAAPHELMQASLAAPVRGDRPASEDFIWSYPKYAVFRDAQTSFGSVGLYTGMQVTVRGDEGAERITSEVVDQGYLPTLAVQPVLGRNFTEAEAVRPGEEAVVLIGDALWRRHFDADPRVLGRTLTLDGRPHVIAGVLPPGFRGLTGEAELWTPLAADGPEVLEQAWSHSFYVVARRAPGVSEARAEAEVRELGRRIDAAYPHPEVADEHWGAVARPLDAARVDPTVRRSFLVLLAAVGLVLLIACANVANLFLVRAAGRRREIAVRLAVGAGRTRVVRQLVTESLLLAALGGAGGLLVAWWGTRALAAVDPTVSLRSSAVSGVGAVGFEGIRLDPTVLLFALGVTLLTGFLFGLAPALQATRPSMTSALKDGGLRDEGRRRLRGRTLLAVGEIALALVLLAGSGLMLRSLGKLLAVSSGVDVEHVLTLRTTATGVVGRDSLPAFYDDALPRLAGLPGVTHAALGNCAPLSGRCNGTGIVRRDRPEPAPGTAPSTGVQWITPDWLATMRVPVLRGRGFEAGDRVGAPKVVLVSASLAARVWPGEDPIGRPVSVGQGGFWEDTARVVGVVGDVRFGALEEAETADVYLPYHQSPSPRMIVFLRTSGDPLAVARAARAALAEVAPAMPVYDVRTMADRAADATAYARFSAVLLAMFAGTALLLAAIGVYGVTASAVAQRTREIGVRVALGATRGDVLRGVVGQGLGIALAGAALGLAAALGATRVLRSLLYGVAPTDPATFAAIVVVLVGAVLAASWLPARRAASIAPTEALREG